MLNCEVNRKLGQRGFTLIHALVGLGITAVIALVGARTMSSLSRDSVRLESKSTTQSLVQGLQVYLSNENVCKKSLGTTTITDPKEVSLSFNIPGFGEVKPGAVNEATQLKSDKVFVENATVLETNSLGMKIYAGLFKVGVSREKASMIDTMASRSVGVMSLMTNSEGQVIKCVLGSLRFASVPNDDPTLPDTEIPKDEDTNNDGVDDNVAGSDPAPLCSSIEECAVYDYYVRNGIPNAYVQAKSWMSSNSNWKTIARSYIDSMSVLGKLNFLATADHLGLVQSSGKLVANGSKNDTIDQWVAETVNLDPSGKAMFATKKGIDTIQYLFDSSSETSKESQNILRTLLVKSPELTMNSALGINTWVDALGYGNALEFAKANPSAAMAAALSPGAIADPSALNAVVKFIQTDPAAATTIANGTGMWSKYANGGVDAVVKAIGATVVEVGGVGMVANIATGTSLWAENYKGGSGAVGEVIKNNPEAALLASQGTGIAAQIWGDKIVADTIAKDPAMAAKISSELGQFVKETGATPEQLASYITNHPDSWQKDLEAATSGKQGK